MVLFTRLFSKTRGKQHGGKPITGVILAIPPIPAFPTSFPLFPKEKEILKILYAAPPYMGDLSRA
jgi:hypothetical protein